MPCITLTTLAYIYLAASVLTFLLMGIDKYLATIYAYRISEANLISASFLFGWPGAVIGMKLFNHKANKQNFKTALLMVSIANIALLAFLYKQY